MARERRVRRLIEDAGEKIGNARKDLSGALTRADLDAMSAAERAVLVTKDRVWPKPAWGALVSAGMEPACAALLKIDRDRIAVRPTALSGASFAATSEAYFTALGRIRRLAEACRSRDDARRLQERLEAELGRGGGVAAPAARLELLSICTGRRPPLRFDGRDADRAGRMVEDGFPGQPVGTCRRGLAVAQPGGPVPAAEADRDGARRGVEATARGRRAGDASDGPAIPKRPRLGRLRRVGPDPRGNRDVSSDDFLAAFGFRGVEFGLWLPDAERRAALNLGYDALHDLARAIGWEPRGLSLGGGLAVAFGARGSDRSPAHYEPGRAVMNLTRLRGAGYVAHEWGHAFDHWLGRLGGDEVEDGEPRFASGNGKHSGSRSRALPRLPGRLAGALDALVSAFRQRATTPGEALADARKALDESRVELAEIERTIASDSARVNGGWDGVEARTWAGWRTKWARLVGSLEGRIAALEAGDEVALPTRRSSFFENAIALSGSATGYYARPAELWARAFEAMVADRLAEAGERSDYLVSGVEEGYFAGPGFKGDPYPAGEERRRLSAMMFEIVDLARPLVPEPVRELVAPPGR